MSDATRAPHLPLVGVFGDAPMAEIWSEAATIAAWCEVEVALAAAQAELGIIPDAAADAIAAFAVPDRIATERLHSGMRTVGYPILPLLDQIRAGAPDAVSGYLHWGATTQDIMDTALALVLARALDRMAALVTELGDGLATITSMHRATPMAARTHDQMAVPTTLGAKLAVYLVELARHRRRLAAARGGVAVVSLFGAGGTAAALGSRSRDTRHAAAARLGLTASDVPWHVARDGIAEAGFAMAAIAATAGKLAREVIALSRTEVGEVREVGGHHRGASSTMPQKANPISSELAVGFSILASAQVPVLLAAMQPRHERAAGEWQAEWDALPLLATSAAGAVAAGLEIVAGLQVDPARMAANLAMDGGLIMAEAVMMALAPLVGRGPAHDIVYAASTAARERGITLRDALEARLDATLRDRLPPLAELLDPARSLGEAPEIADRGIAAWRAMSEIA